MKTSWYQTIIILLGIAAATANVSLWFSGAVNEIRTEQRLFRQLIGINGWTRGEMQDWRNSLSAAAPHPVPHLSALRTYPMKRPDVSRIGSLSGEP